MIDESMKGETLTEGTETIGATYVNNVDIGHHSVPNDMDPDLEHNLNNNNNNITRTITNNLVMANAIRCTCCCQNNHVVRHAFH